MSDAAHPCFSCKLSDCDDSNKRCGLRKAMARYNFFVRRKQPIPDAVRALKAIAQNELFGYLRERDKRLPRNRENRNEQ